MGKEDIIRNFKGQIIGYVETENNGDKTFRNFYRRILGYYDKALNVTRDFYKRVIARGDAGVGLIYAEAAKEEAEEEARRQNRLNNNRNNNKK